MLENKQTILAVDDSFVNINILNEILKDEYNVVTAGNGKEALEILGDIYPLPKLILLDFIMPVMTGREMYNLMKTNDKLKRIPVIFITAKNDSECELLEAGAVDFINKPFKPEIVKLRVKNQISLKNYSDSLEVLVAEKSAEVTQTLNNSLLGLAGVIEDRDLESSEHIKRTQLYVKAIIDFLIGSDSIYAQQLLDLQPDIIIKASSLHDVGKLAIPDKILLKPGILTLEEFEIMKTHTTRGKKIINRFDDISLSIYLKHCEDICYYHHERWDGKGYPCQISGTAIPLTARILSVADVYDAITSKRVYKDAISHEQAMEIIAQGRGTQFDPIITDVMMLISSQIETIAKTYR
ncbi:MAG: response regulator [Treponema sp.]|nr:response regulator [Treponema sp.]